MLNASSIKIDFKILDIDAYSTYVSQIFLCRKYLSTYLGT